MAESFGTKLTLIEVRSDESISPKKRLWVAAAKPSQALTLVLSAVPEGWIAELATAPLTRQQLQRLASLNLKPGEVCELTE